MFCGGCFYEQEVKAWKPQHISQSGLLFSQHFLFSFISAKIFILFLSSFLLQFNAFLVKTSPLLARKFLVQTFIFSVFTPENKAKTKAIGKDSSSRKEKKKGKICWKIKDFGKDSTNLANGFWSRSLLRQKRRPWSSFPMTQGLQNYYIVCFCSDLSNRERIKKIAPKRINHFCWNIVWPCTCDYTS